MNDDDLKQWELQRLISEEDLDGLKILLAGGDVDWAKKVSARQARRELVPQTPVT